MQETGSAWRWPPSITSTSSAWQCRQASSVTFRFPSVIAIGSWKVPVVK